MPLTIQIRGRAAELALQATSRDREAGSMLCSGISRKGALSPLAGRSTVQRIQGHPASHVLRSHLKTGRKDPKSNTLKGLHAKATTLK